MCRQGCSDRQGANAENEVGIAEVAAVPQVIEEVGDCESQGRRTRRPITPVAPAWRLLVSPCLALQA